MFRFVEVLEPGAPLTPQNSEIVNGLPKGMGYRTMRRLFQNKVSASVFKVGSDEALKRFGLGK